MGWREPGRERDCAHDRERLRARDREIECIRVCAGGCVKMEHASGAEETVHEYLHMQTRIYGSTRTLTLLLTRTRTRTHTRLCTHAHYTCTHNDVHSRAYRQRKILARLLRHELFRATARWQRTVLERKALIHKATKAFRRWMHGALVRSRYFLCININNLTITHFV
jgi:hypothetical protein